jgi:hypothetical protein
MDKDINDMQLNMVKGITRLTKVMGMVLIKEARSGSVTNFDLPRIHSCK